MHDDLSNDEPLATQGPLGTPAIVGIVAGLIPFFIHFGTSSTRTVNGQVVESTTTNYVGIGGGVVAIAAGILAVTTAANAGANAGKARIAGAAVILLGAYQLIRGAGIV